MAAKQELITRFSGDARPLTKAAAKVKKVVAGVVAGVAGYGGYKLMAGSVSQAARFEKKMALVKGMLDGISDEGFENIKRSIRDVVVELGAAHEAGGDVAYMLASNSIAGEALDEYAAGILGLSKALDTDVNSMGQTLLRSMAAWGLGAEQLEHVKDVIAGMAKVGNMTGQDLAQYFSRFSSEAAGLGFSMEEAGSAFAIATREARPEQAAAGMRMLLSTIGKGNTALDQMGAKGKIATKGLIGGVSDLVGLAKDNPKLLNKMFPEANARMMALIIANNAKTMGEAFQRLTKDTKLFESMLDPVMDTMDARWGKLKSQVVDLGLSFGEELMPKLKAFVEDIREIAADPQLHEDAKDLADAAAVGVKVAGGTARGMLGMFRGYKDFFRYTYGGGHKRETEAWYNDTVLKGNGGGLQAAADYAKQMLVLTQSQTGIDSAKSKAWEQRVANIMARVEANTRPVEAQ